MTDWEMRYRQGDMPWEKGAAGPPLLELMASWNDGPAWGGGPVLVPGCGYGHDVREIARGGVLVLGVDLSVAAVKGAEQFEKVGAEAYQVADLFDRRWWPAAGFAGWWEHTCFCAIDPSDRPRYAEAAAAILQPGGWLCGVFFLTPNDPGEEGQGPPFASTREEIIGLLEPWFDLVNDWVPETGYAGRVSREWLAIFRKRIQPAEALDGRNQSLQ